MLCDQRQPADRRRLDYGHQDEESRWRADIQCFHRQSWQRYTCFGYLQMTSTFTYEKESCNSTNDCKQPQRRFVQLCKSEASAFRFARFQVTDRRSLRMFVVIIFTLLICLLEQENGLLHVACNAVNSYICLIYKCLWRKVVNFCAQTCHLACKKNSKVTSRISNRYPDFKAFLFKDS